MPPFVRSFLLLAATCALLFAPGARGIAYAQSTELSSFPFLQFEPSARAAALGGAFPIVGDDDANALFYNPAALSPVANRSGTLTYLNHLSDINAGILAYSHTVDRLATFGGGLRFLSWGTFEGANEFGERTGSFGAGDAALTVGAARALGPRWRYGVSLHAIYSRLADAQAAAVGLDVGVLFPIPSQQITLHASINRLGRAVDSFGAARDRLPTDVRLGLTKRLRYLPFLISVTGYDLHNLGDGLAEGTTLDRVLAHLLLGGELSIHDVFQVRLGYNHRRSEELARSDGFDAAGLSAGFGLTIAPLRVSYAYQSWSSFGGLHWLTLRAQL